MPDAPSAAVSVTVIGREPPAVLARLALHLDGRGRRGRVVPQHRPVDGGSPGPSFDPRSRLHRAATGTGGTRLRPAPPARRCAGSAIPPRRPSGPAGAPPPERSPSLYVCARNAAQVARAGPLHVEGIGAAPPRWRTGQAAGAAGATVSSLTCAGHWRLTLPAASVE